MSYQLSVTDRTTQIMPKINKRVVEIDNYDNLVWCIESNNHNFIARRNGSVFLTGNYHSYNLDDKRYINVCVENVGYLPQDLNEILEKHGTILK